MTGPRTIAVVVTHLPEAERFQALLASLLAQVDQVLVVDNTPAGRGEAEHVVTGHPAYGEQLRIVRCGENVGIAAALNIGIGAAISENFDYVLLSDQDSLPDRDMAFHLRRVLEELERSGFNPACVMPCYADEVTQQRFGFQVQRKGSLFYSICDADEATPFIEVLSGITSGSLYRVAVFPAVGLMKEEYFIDYVDTEWFHRARARGFRLFGTSSAVLGHRLGEDSFPVWYWGWRPFTAYPPRRLYFRFRNFVAMYREKYVPLPWKVRAGWYWLGNLYAYLIFSPNRRVNAKYIFRGLRDGLGGRMGRFDG